MLNGAGCNLSPLKYYLCLPLIHSHNFAYLFTSIRTIMKNFILYQICVSFHLISAVVSLLLLSSKIKLLLQLQRKIAVIFICLSYSFIFLSSSFFMMFKYDDKDACCFYVFTCKFLKDFIYIILFVSSF